MKRQAVGHTKMKKLCRALHLRTYVAVGMLESLWHLTAREAPLGDIGRLTNEDIAIGIDYEGDPDKLIDSLVSVGWLDRCAKHRLIVHDWSEHADDTTKKTITRKGLLFAVVWKCPEMSGHVATNPEINRLPEPEPEPVPEPDIKPFVRTSSDEGESPVLELVSPETPEAKAERRRKFLDETHDEFYRTYWRRVGKPRSRKAWPRAIISVTKSRKVSTPEAARFLIDKALSHKNEIETRADLEWLEKMHPSSWLNGERWEDELSPPKAKAAAAAGSIWGKAL